MRRRWEEARQALDAAQSRDGLGTRLRRVGYGPERLEEGEALLAGVTLAMEQADEAITAQRKATRLLNQARNQLERSHRDAVQLVKVALGEDHPWLEEAGVPSRRARGEGPAPRDNSLEGVMASAQQFFDAAQSAPEEVKELLAEVGLGLAAIAMGRGLITGVERAAATQSRAMEEAAKAIEVRGNAFETLDDWMRLFVTAARVSLRDRPDLLSALGIRPRGRPRKRE